jgi:hypothetical protein
VSNFPAVVRSANFDVQPALGDGSITPAEIRETNAAICGAGTAPAANSSITGFVNYLDDILPAKVVNSTVGL